MLIEHGFHTNQKEVELLKRDDYREKLARADCKGILDYLDDAPLYDYVDVNGRQFILVHAGLENFTPDKPFHRYEPEELLWVRPGLETRYFDEATVIFGHTPTYHYGEEYRGKAVKTDTWICIDTGAAAGGRPMLLRLDDMAEFY